MWQKIRLWLKRKFTSQLSLGKQGEQLAARFLKQKGMVIVARNHRNRFGEIDLIAYDNQTVVFVEVRTRSGAVQGRPVETIGFSKQQKLTRAAIYFLKSRQLQERSSRFDVVTIIWGKQCGQEQLEYFPNAFAATE